jgi:hypothetical protein
MLQRLDPSERRIRELILAATLLLEASGARPESIYGLTWADVHLHDGGDFIHLRSSGTYAEIKTQTTEGFVPLEGSQWAKHRAWFATWLEDLRRTKAVDDWIDLPLLAEPGAPAGDRYRDALVFGRIGELIRWRTGQPRGRTYWLRKRRITLRHVLARQGKSPTARDVYRVMKSSGHATIATPVADYLGDPLAWMDPARPSAPPAQRVVSAAFSGTKIEALDQRWLRQRRKESTCSSDWLAGVMCLTHPTWPQESRPPAPQYNPYRQGISVRAVELVMDGLSRGLSSKQVSHHSGVHTVLVDDIKTKGDELARRTGMVLGSGIDALHRPKQWRMFLRLVDHLARETEALTPLAREWGNCARLRAPRNAIVLIDEGVVAALGALAAKLGCRVRRQDAGDGTWAYSLEAGGEPVHGGEKLLQWAMAVVWIGNGIAAAGAPGR